jgi:hypothetical protein
MVSYNRRLIRAQLGCLVLAVTMFALPLAGIRVAPAPILTPLNTELVPLGTNLQSTPNSPLDRTSFVSPSRLVLRPLPSVIVPNVDSNGRIRNITNLGFANSHAIDIPNGRSPPSD